MIFIKELQIDAEMLKNRKLFFFPAKRRIFVNNSKNITLSLFYNGQSKKNRIILRWVVTEKNGDILIFMGQLWRRMRQKL